MLDYIHSLVCCMFWYVCPSPSLQLTYQLTYPPTLQSPIYAHVHTYRARCPYHSGLMEHPLLQHSTGARIRRFHRERHGAAGKRVINVCVCVCMCMWIQEGGSLLVQVREWLKGALQPYIKGLYLWCSGWDVED